MYRIFGTTSCHDWKFHVQLIEVAKPILPTRGKRLGRPSSGTAMPSAIEDFMKEAQRVEKARQDAVRNSDRAKLVKINDALVRAERQFLDQRGLRGRAWYKHQIYAPGFYTGYASQPLTDFRQALDDRNTTNAKEGLGRIVEALKRATRTLREAL